MAGHKKTPNAKPIINITIDEKLLEQIEHYRFDKRFNNRSQAMCKLIELGFKYLEENEPKKPEQTTDSFLLEGLEELIKQYKALGK